MPLFQIELKVVPLLTCCWGGDGTGEARSLSVRTGRSASSFHFFPDGAQATISGLEGIHTSSSNLMPGILPKPLSLDATI